MNLSKSFKKSLFFIFISIFLFSLIGFSLAAVQVDSNANLTKIDTGYGPGATLSGSIKFSLNKEPFDSLLKASFTGSSDEIKLKDFLNNAGANYTCSTSECGYDYSVSGTGEDVKTLSFSAGESKIIGLKLTGSVESISGFSLNVSSSSSSDSCSTPLKIDVLNDKVNEWIAYSSSEDFSCSELDSYGCYDSSAPDSSEVFITTTAYCSKIEVPASPKIKIGANLQGSGTASFTMTISNDYKSDTCGFEVSSPGESGCVVNIATDREQEFEVCISTESQDENKYTIGSETTAPCGHVGDEEKDFAIFARPAKYTSVGKFVLSTSEITTNLPDLSENSNLEEYVSAFISEKYGGDCTAGCIIPINFTSGISQTLTLSSAAVFYSSASGASTKSSKIFDVSQSPSSITMDSSQLDLSTANLQVPETYGNNSLTLTLGSQTIFSNKQITILQVPVITTLYPQKAPAAINILFKAYLSGNNVTSYKWNFGDNSSVQETAESTIIHKYAELGTYSLNVETENSLGKSSKTFQIEVLSPEQYINFLLNKSSADIAKVKNQLTNFAPWVQTYLGSKLNTNSMETELAKLKTDYENAAGATDVYVSVINSLDALNIPESVTMSDSSSSVFLIDRDIIDANALEIMGAGTSTEGLKDALFEWAVDSMSILVNEEVYSVSIDGVNQPLASKFTVSITPKQTSLGEVYFMINQPKDKIGLKETSLDLKTAGQSSGIIFSDLGDKEIEFILEGSIDILNTPIYLSPPIAKLSQYLLGAQIDVTCNNNNICESASGENWKTCRHDCTAWPLILTWLLILLFIGLVLYIAMQEWYKRRYENWLFKDKNDLFNLINFMDNAEKQGLIKEDIFKKLMEKSWIKEQVQYAWKKYKGERTGMWEIPVFVIFDKMKIKKELDKRKAAGITGKIAPIPHFMPGSPSTQSNQQSRPVNKP